MDEFQDFNRMEASVIDLLAERNAILIAGDDDQALYSQLRGASWEYIRHRYESGHYEIFELPFCMRCPEVIVGAVNDIIVKAREGNKLNGRIEKPYRFYEPVKGDDSLRYPRIELVETSVQRANANYFGRYIEQAIKGITEEERHLAAEKNEPVALVIGSNPYRRQVEEYLTSAGLLAAGDGATLSDREQALAILRVDPASNLAWRLILAEGEERAARDLVRLAAEEELPLAEVMSADDRAAVLREAGRVIGAPGNEPDGGDPIAPAVKVTSFEGAKGLSAQYGFLIDLHSGEMPRNAQYVQDIEICRFLVGLTKTKKKCSILVTRRFGDQFKRRSEFLSWIAADRFEEREVNAAYWERQRAA